MNILTFDLEDWFHILEQHGFNPIQDWEMLEVRFPQNIDRILKLLQKHNQTATFFCMGWIARKYPDEIRKIAELGYEVGCHSNMHQLIHSLTPSAYKQSMKDAILSIEDITGTPVRSYRAPGFSLTKETLWAYDILAELGIENDCSIFPTIRAHGGYPDFPSRGPCLVETRSGTIREFPVNTIKFAGRIVIFSGGGYFRVLPYPLIRLLTERSDYVMTYFHPRDFDPGQPMIRELPLSRKFRSYVGLRGARRKLDTWLGDFPFTDINGAISTIDWSSVPLMRPDPELKTMIALRPMASPENTSVATAIENSMSLMGFTIHTKLDDSVLEGTRYTAHGSRFTAHGIAGEQLLINCMNPHSYCLSKKDPVFREALLGSDILIPDGTGIVIAAHILKFKRIRKIAGADLHEFMLKKLNEEHGSCFYLGASQKTLELIRERLAKEYPNITAGFYSPPYKEEFTGEDSEMMVKAVNREIAKWRNRENNSPLTNHHSPLTTHNSLFTTNPSPPHQFTSSPVLFIGMTAPKQEKWSYRFRNQLDVGVICNIGAVFDFYAGTVKRSSPFWIKIGLEWLPRFLKEPKRLYRRVFVSGPLFLWDVLLFRIGIK
jgi:polysaccharide deacetylase family protein (PEP-CTERM system associated)